MPEYLINFNFSVARVRELEEEVQSLTNQLTAKNVENENLASQLEELHSSYSLTRQKSVNLEGSNDKYAKFDEFFRTILFEFLFFQFDC